MLAAKRSFGSLRAAARAQQSCAQAAPAASSLPSQQRNFMSAVLLSRDQFSSKTVVELKKQLKERGLSTQGKKKELVDRLLESVSIGTYGPGVSPSPSSSSRAGLPSQQQQQQASAFSTTARASANAPTATGTVVESEAVPVHAPAAEAAAQATPVTPPPSDELTAGPGLLVNKQEAAHVAETAEEVPGGSIEMPNAVFLPSIERDIQESQHEMMIPEFPHTYKNPVDHDPYTQPFTLHPSWLKVDASAESTVHHAGGSNHVTEDPDSRSSEPRKPFQYSDERTLLQDILADLGISRNVSTPKRIKKAEEALSKQSSAILSMLEETSGIKIPPLSESVKESAPKFEFQDRELNSQEKTGLLTLGGILVGGLLLGSLGARSGESKSEEKHDKSK